MWGSLAVELDSSSSNTMATDKGIGQLLVVADQRQQSMTRSEYVEMVSYIEDRWGPAFWTSAARIYGDFEGLDTDKVYAVLLARTNGDPERARFAPKPAELVALTYQQMRIPTPAPPAIDAGAGSWAIYSQKHYGKVISLGEAMRRRHLELTT